MYTWNGYMYNNVTCSLYRAHNLPMRTHINTLIYVQAHNGTHLISGDVLINK